MGEGHASGPAPHAPDPGCETCTRLRAALRERLRQSDYDALSEADVAGAAMVSLSGHYADLDRCLEALYREVDAEVGEVFATGLQGGGPWRERLADAVVGLYERVDDMPGAIRVYEAARRGPQRLQALAARNRRRHLGSLSRVAPEVSDVHLEFVIGALYRAAQEQVESADVDAGRMRRRALEIIDVLEPLPA